MGKFLKFILGIIIILGLIVAGVYFSGNTTSLVIYLTKPKHDFDLTLKAAAPDYADPANWAALPDKDDPADMMPAGIEAENIQGDAPVDVFFIHPTGYLHAMDWNSTMDPDSMTEENTKWMLANQASSYNGCCNIYAPRYREASIFSYLVGDEVIREQALDFAYGDVERAFDYFLENHSKGRPFIIASHSQGTRHGNKLLKNRIDGTDLRDRMVAAYLIGGGITVNDIEAMDTIDACREPSDLNCVIHWATYGEGGSDDGWNGDEVLLCTNPLSWAVDEQRVDAARHRGGVLPSGKFNIKIWGKDVAEGVVFAPLAEPDSQHTWAQCQDGLLFVALQEDNGYSGYGRMPGHNYHGLDYPLFHMDIRDNAVLRVDAYLARGETEGHMEVIEPEETEQSLDEPAQISPEDPIED